MFALDRERVGGGRIETAFYLKLPKEPKPPPPSLPRSSSRGYFESSKSRAPRTRTRNCTPFMLTHPGTVRWWGLVHVAYPLSKPLPLAFRFQFMYRNVGGR